MEDLERVARLARQLCELLLDGEAIDLRARVQALVEVLPRLWLAGSVLPPVPPLPPPPPGPAAGTWPGLGRFDGGSPTVSEQLAVAEAWLWSGLHFYDEGDAAGALTVWAGGYAVWSTALVATLPALHAAALRFRPEPQLGRPSAAEPSLVMVGGGAEDAPVAVAAPDKPIRPALGVRFEAIGLGAYVCEVHAKSPAAGLVEKGDVVLAVDDLSLEHVDPTILAERMVGPIGERRRYVVYRDGETREVVFAAVALEALRD